MVNCAMTIFGTRERKGRQGVRLHLANIAIALAALSGGGLPASAATITATAKAKVVKPLTLTSIQDFDLGTLLLGPGTWSGATVTLTRNGVLNCPANVTCTGATQVARYNVSGSNQQAVTITAPNVTMVNQSDSTKTLVLTVDSPGTVALPNSGNPGVIFPLGGSITVGSTTPGGVYAGTFNVTVDYQ
jgi:hypothetical protein